MEQPETRDALNAVRIRLLARELDEDRRILRPLLARIGSPSPRLAVLLAVLIATSFVVGMLAARLLD